MEEIVIKIGNKKHIMVQASREEGKAPSTCSECSLYERCAYFSKDAYLEYAICYTFGGNKDSYFIEKSN